MDVTTLVDMGLSPAQAKTYKILVESSSSTAPRLSLKIEETRTNTYKLLDKLCELGLATKEEVGKKLTYFPASPGALERLIESKTAAIELQARKLKANLPSMLSYYLEHTEQPSIRYYQGLKGIEEIYQDQLDERSDIYLIRSWKDRDLFPAGTFSIWRKRPALYGLKTIVLAPDVEDANPSKEQDKKFLHERTWIKAEDYTAPVEWDIYGNKVSIISFGTEAMGIVIESEQIADSMRQLFQIIQKGLKSDPEYKTLPKRAKQIDDPRSRHKEEYKKLLSDIENAQAKE